MMFDGSSGRRPSAEARRYVYMVLATSLDVDLQDPDGWMFGGMENEVDRRRVRKAAVLVIAELQRKGNR
jgi:hypothetical protein